MENIVYERHEQRGRILGNKVGMMAALMNLLMIKGEFSLLFSYDSIEKYDFFLQTVWIL
ncbi:hypothetical protein [Caecibacteroides pullorum]|uniref:Uncharacterized protein n=1 Tax=Caecibacteroides pullorum TaxID=2725562 RepID=A0AA40ZVN4_9BACT|nr:hypothetical protein [Caecibacteroides pullorum]MBM6858727.1 hypothetical protein [Caecibacteroides pullorum]MBV8059752.1 hypothetical protein [Caecibacteroides pullorum]